MIYSYLDGQLGNILFEIAAGASLAKRLGVPFKAIGCHPFSQSGTITEYVKPFQQSVLRKIDFLDFMPENVEVYTESGFVYNPLPLKRDLILKGCFQSEKYLDRETVRSLFEIDQETDVYIKNKYGHILNKKPVGIHVRRGDYLLLEYKHPVCRMPYFKKAMSLFDKGTSFLVMSNDIAWCKKHFKGDNFYFSENESPIVDFYLQSKCSHNVISNSSYSWWAAWLNPNPDKKVIYPSPWFGPCYKNILNFKDLCPEEWVAIPHSSFYSLYYHAGSSYLGKIAKKIAKVCGLKNL